MRTFRNTEEVTAAIGEDLGTSDWIPITQARIDEFANATEDRLWIHTDPVRAAQGPFGSTIAHGFLVVSLVAPVISQVVAAEGFSTMLNYGLDRVRFPRPLRVGRKVRGQVTLQAVDEIPGGIRATYRVQMQTDEDETKPVCVADLLTAYLV